MSYLIQINEKTGEVLHPEILKLCDSFMALNEKEMLYVALFTDYNSIYKQYPEHERKRRAMWHAFNENESGLIETSRIQVAIKDYTSLQYDPKIELVKTYQKKIDTLSELIEQDNSPTSLEKTLKSIKSLRENILSLQSEVLEQTLTDGVIKGDRHLSFLEKIISNKKLYKSLIKER